MTRRAKFAEWWRSVGPGLRQARRWLPVVWHDRDYDWEFLFRLMSAKLRYMERAARTRWATGGPQCREARDMQVCAALLERLVADRYDGIIGGQFSLGRYRLADKQREADLELFCKIFKKARAWWD